VSRIFLRKMKPPRQPVKEPPTPTPPIKEPPGEKPDQPKRKLPSNARSGFRRPLVLSPASPDDDRLPWELHHLLLRRRITGVSQSRRPGRVP
jgi:hypothetical protein